eukprot:441198-Pelagomonas_calceolata.AAC.6
MELIDKGTVAQESRLARRGESGLAGRQCRNPARKDERACACHFATGVTLNAPFLGFLGRSALLVASIYPVSLSKRMPISEQHKGIAAAKEHGDFFPAHSPEPVIWVVGQQLDDEVHALRGDMGHKLGDASSLLLKCGQ